MKGSNPHRDKSCNIPEAKFNAEPVYQNVFNAKNYTHHANYTKGYNLAGVPGSDSHKISKYGGQKPEQSILTQNLSNFPANRLHKGEMSENSSSEIDQNWNNYSFENFSTINHTLKCPEPQILKNTKCKTENRAVGQENIMSRSQQVTKCPIDFKDIANNRIGVTTKNKSLIDRINFTRPVSISRSSGVSSNLTSNNTKRNSPVTNSIRSSLVRSSNNRSCTTLSSDNIGYEVIEHDYSHSINYGMKNLSLSSGANLNMFSKINKLQTGNTCRNSQSNLQYNDVLQPKMSTLQLKPANKILVKHRSNSLSKLEYNQQSSIDFQETISTLSPLKRPSRISSRIVKYNYKR